MYIVHVYAKVKENEIEKFITATIQNAKNSLNEPGVVRFDFMQDLSNKQEFLLTEVYVDEQAPLEHKKTEHYLKWREIVAEMMVEPRRSVKYSEIYPKQMKAWRVNDCR